MERQATIRQLHFEFLAVELLQQRFLQRSGNFFRPDVARGTAHGHLRDGSGRPAEIESIRDAFQVAGIQRHRLAIGRCGRKDIGSVMRDAGEHIAHSDHIARQRHIGDRLGGMRAVDEEGRHGNCHQELLYVRLFKIHDVSHFPLPLSAISAFA